LAFRRIIRFTVRMSDPLHDRDRMMAALSVAVEAAREYMERLDSLPARSPRSDEAAAHGAYAHLQLEDHRERGR
jgi:hypothetical protein